MTRPARVRSRKAGHGPRCDTRVGCAEKFSERRAVEKSWRLEKLPLAKSMTDLITFVWNHPLNRERRGRALARLLTWQAWERLTGLPWTIRLTRDIRIRCYPHSAAASLVVYCRLPEWQEMRFVLDFLRSGDAFVDIGANVGVYSLLACSIRGVKVYAFEPSSLSYTRAVENIRLNGLEDRVRVEKKAVGSATGKGTLTVGLDCVNCLVPAGTNHPVEEVDIITLDSYFDESARDRVGLVKIDVEGAEHDVLSGARALLASRGPALIVEFNEPQAIQSILEPLGYQLYEYEPEQRSLVSADARLPTANNLIAVKDKRAVEARLRLAKVCDA